jgi:hypothetical protein
LLSSYQGEKLELQPLVRALETWQLALYLHLMSAPLAGRSLAFAAHLMPVVNIDLTYSAFSSHVNQAGTTAFGNFGHEDTVLNQNMRIFGYISSDFFQNTHFLFFVALFVAAIILLSILKKQRPKCYGNVHPLMYILKMLDSLCMMNFLVAAWIQLIVGAPQQILDFKNVLAFALISYYWVIMPVIKIVQIKTA